jgi:hypothetical protein
MSTVPRGFPDWRELSTVPAGHRPSHYPGFAEYAHKTAGIRIIPAPELTRGAQQGPA